MGSSQGLWSVWCHMNANLGTFQSLSPLVPLINESALLSLLLMPQALWRDDLSAWTTGSDSCFSQSKERQRFIYVPPWASYNGCKVNNSISHFQPGHPLRDTSFLTGPIKEIQTLGTDGSLVEMSCSLVRRWVLLSIQWGLGKWGGAVAGGCCEFLWGLGLHHWYRVLVIVSNSSSWVFTEGQTEERE